MDDKKKPNPFAGFDSTDETSSIPIISHGHSPAIIPPPIQVASDTAGSEKSTTEAPKKNPFAGFDTIDEEDRNAASLNQAMGIGAVVGGYKGAKHALHERENVELRNQGSQGYLSGMIPPDMKLTIKNLQELTGMPVRTQSEIQAALAKLQATPATREARIVESPSGKKIRSGYTTTPATEHVDLSKFTIPPKGKVVTSGGATGAVAGALAAPALFQAATQDKPLDWTQWSALAGVLPTIAPKLANFVPGLKQVAPYLGVPYAIKHRDELLQGMTMNDINPTGMPLGTVGSEESPMQEPARPSPLQSQAIKANEDQRKKMFYSANP
jgi:hypothetical protein